MERWRSAARDLFCLKAFRSREEDPAGGWNDTLSTSNDEVQRCNFFDLRYSTQKDCI